MDELKDIARQAKTRLPVLKVDEVKYNEKANLIFMTYTGEHGGRVFCASFDAENVKETYGGLK
jgi:hypothetical protein